MITCNKRTAASVLLAVALSTALGSAQDITTARRIADLNPGSVGSFPSNIVAFGNSLYFSAYTLNTGRELWKYNGSAITLATNINDTADDIGFGTLEGNDSVPDWLTAFNGSLYFSAFDPRRGGELWRYNGTNAFRVADINPDGNDTIKFIHNNAWPHQLTVMGTNLYFVADNNPQVRNYELWRHDGINTVMVTNIHPSSGMDFSSYPSGLTVFNGALYFMADDGTNSYELWKHDGVSTVLLTNINPAPLAGSYPRFFTPLGSRLLFTADDGLNGTELWRTDGTNASLLSDINPAGSSNPEFLTRFKDAVLFRASDGSSGVELWKSDGLSASRAADINPVGDSNPKNLTVFRDKLYFAADDGVHGWELWSYDGSSAALVMDLNPSGDSFPEMLTVCADVLYFAATNAVTGYELFKFDGTAISIAADINPGGASSYPFYAGLFGSELFFSANDSPYSDWELWAIKSLPFRFTSIRRLGSDVRLAWRSTGGTTNVVQAAVSLEGPFNDVSGQIIVPGTGTTTVEYTHPGPFSSSATRFYRVVAR